MNDEAYFGSWSLSHRIPEDLEKDIFKSKFILLSWSSRSLNLIHEKFSDKKILLPDHVGARS